MTSVLHYDLLRTPPRAVSGHGAWVVDADGNEWLDGTAGAGAVTLGYGIDEITGAMVAQLGSMPYAYKRHFTTGVLEDLADEVARLAPEGLTHSFFVTGGSEANESAIKIVRQYQVERGRPSKYRVLSLWPSYHGATLATLSLSGRPSWSNLFRPMLTPVDRANAPYALWRGHPGQTSTELARACAADLATRIRAVGPENVAAVIAEPILGGTAPAVTPPDGYWALVREICDENDVVLIFDEVFTGFGRTGRVFASEHWGVDPDVITCGKGISSGYAPLGAAIFHDRIADVLRAGSGGVRHSFTYAGHPVPAAAGLAAVRFLTERRYAERSEELGRRLLERLSVLAEVDGVAEVRGGRGLLCGIEFAAPDELSLGRSTRAARVAALCAESHVLISTAANGDQLQLMPPIAITADEVDRLSDVVVAAVRDACP